MARNRYGWNKRAKEMARKQKSEEKLKRRQNKSVAVAAVEITEQVEGAEGENSPLGEA